MEFDAILYVRHCALWVGILSLRYVRNRVKLFITIVRGICHLQLRISTTSVKWAMGNSANRVFHVRHTHVVEDWRCWWGRGRVKHPGSVIGCLVWIRKSNDFVMKFLTSAKPFPRTIVALIGAVLVP